jgi:nitroimidazol reductase NimA-like FMN-containing flavoprotein (pyridoxamine 5'-phosphate oxidase superfamily)
MTAALSPEGAAIVLTDEECRTLLRSRTLGRVALVSGALPEIVPVEYVFDEVSITFRAEHDAKLRAAAPGDVLAFEVDAYDPVSGDVASVHVLGRTSVFVEPPVSGPAPHQEFVRLHCEILKGRRIRSPRD